jgi:hypothetical protein
MMLKRVKTYLNIKSKERMKSTYLSNLRMARVAGEPGGIVSRNAVISACPEGANSFWIDLIV